MVVIAIDDDTIVRLGWPLPRHQYSRLIERVWESHPPVCHLIFPCSISIDHPEWDSFAWGLSGACRFGLLHLFAVFPFA